MGSEAFFNNVVKFHLDFRLSKALLTLLFPKITQISQAILCFYVA